MIKFGQTTRENIKKEIKDIFKDNSLVMVTSFKGLRVGKIEGLRKSLSKESSLNYEVVKNSLARRAAKECNVDFLVPVFEGTCGIVFSPEGEEVIKASRILAGFNKENKDFKICGGFVSEKEISIDDINEYAQIPSREVLLARVVGGMKAPISGFVGVLNNLVGGFVRVLEQIKKSKE